MNLMSDKVIAIGLCSSYVLIKSEHKRLKELQKDISTHVLQTKSKLCYYISPTYSPASKFNGKPKLHHFAVHIGTAFPCSGYRP